MSRVEIDLMHHLCPGCCMWSGIEDVYCTMMGMDVPEGFLMMMASFAEIVYLRFPSKENARMFTVADARPIHTYAKMKEVMGLEYHICDGKSYEQAIQGVYKEIDGGNPVILGPLDMYYLPYMKMYHHYHVPIHYVVMVGYDTYKKSVLIYDCDREHVIELPEEELKRAWDIKKNYMGNCNGYVRFRLPAELKDPEQILSASMKRKAAVQLSEKPYMVGISAFQKAAKDFPNWKKEMSEQSYRTTLMHLPELWGKVPKLPDRFYGAGPDHKDVPYQANMDRFSNCLEVIGKKSRKETYIAAAGLFAQSGYHYQEITDRLVAYICDGMDSLGEIPNLLLQIGRLYEKAYRMFL